MTQPPQPPPDPAAEYLRQAQEFLKPSRAERWFDRFAAMWMGLIVAITLAGCLVGVGVIVLFIVV